MSRENIEVARRLYKVFADGLNEQTVLAGIEAGLIDPDSELDLRAAYPDGRIWRLGELSEFLDSQPWGRSVRFEPESFRPVGADRVLVLLRLHMVGSGSGVEVGGRVAHLLTVREGRAVRLESYTDRGRALKAAELPE